MQIRFILCLIFHNYKSEKSGGWVSYRMVGGGGNSVGSKTGYCPWFYHQSVTYMQHDKNKS